MRISRNYLKISVCIFTVLCSIVGTNSSARAGEVYPSRPIMLTVGYSAGGGTDITARLLASAMEKVCKQPVVVVNKPGGASSIQMEFVRQSTPDGYTLGMYSGMTATHLRKVPFHFFNDFYHIAQVGYYILGIAVHVDSPWMTLKDLLEYAKKNPGKLRYGATPVGTPEHLLCEQLAYLNDFKWVHVPYTGDGEAGTALLGKHVDLIPTSAAGWQPHVKAGKLRLLAVFHDERLREFPDVPTGEELGYPGISGFFGIFGPKGLPSNIKEKIGSVVKVATNDPDYKNAQDKRCMPAAYKERDEWVSYLKKYDKEIVKIMKRIGLKVVRDAWE
jgi:tripartite-type tricarboxylate transporter receptor subunit TctC